MEFLSYDNIKNIINDYCKDKIFVERMITDSEIKKGLLKPFVSNLEDVRIGSFKQIMANDFTFFEYDTINDDNKVVNNILFVKENVTIFKLEYFDNKGYIESTYSIFKDGSNRLSDRLSFKSYSIDDYENLNISVLGQFSNENSDYFQKKYCLYIFNNKITALETSGNMYLENEAGFSNVVRTFENLVGKFYLKFGQKLDCLKGEEVKEYHILRKKQGQ